jgi:hypothetical protein
MEAKKVYRELSKENHPDKGGSIEMMQQINIEYERFLKNFIDGRVNDFAADKDYDINSEPFSDMLKKVMDFDMDIEIIGFWIYARDCWSVEEKNTLKDLGFWYSKKHKAYVFSGSKKKKIRSKLTTADIRDIHGSTDIKTREEKKAIA